MKFAEALVKSKIPCPLLLLRLTLNVYLGGMVVVVFAVVGSKA